MELTFDKLALSKPVPKVKPALDTEAGVVAARQKLMDFQNSYKENLDNGNLTPVPYKYTHHFSEMHPVFNCAMYGRELAMPAGAIIVGKIHKYPVFNVLLKGKLAVVSENGQKVLEAPATYMSEAGVRRVGYVLEDCVWLNVVLTDKVGEEFVDEITDFHTTDSYDNLSIDNTTFSAIAPAKNRGT